MEVFFTLIFAVLLLGANFYMRPEYLTIAISNLNFNFPPCDVYVGGKVRVLELMRFFYLKHSGSKINFVL